MERLFLIGLGNPDKLYFETRHNVGWMFIDFVSRERGIPLKAGRGEYLIGEKEGIYLVKPLTYMNLSGIAVRQVVERYRIEDLKELVIVHDDADMDFGKLRMRLKGGSGGHKGIESVIYHLMTDEFPRLKIGIGRGEGQDLRDYVLSPFGEEEKQALPSIFSKALKGRLMYREKGPEAAMNFINSET
ncbi:MAG: aminoacyl-tRNA hydrolase [Candidatus Hydrothermae bacterium]|nr:aminoacyl-tRNA hydrolase [Candidatus Hydrothermae bacterium]